MAVLQNKIDFKAFLVVENANCNGDPLNGNMPRTTMMDTARCLMYV